MFKEIWVVDFEFRGEDGDRPEPVCMVAWELVSRRRVFLWQGEFPAAPPYSTGPDSLFIAFSSPAEFSCTLELGWPRPQNVLDLYVEFRCRSNGVTPPEDINLLAVCRRFRIQTITDKEKEYWQALVLRAGPWSLEQREGILHYCETDVVITAELYEQMLPEIDLERALLRGRYMHAVARMVRVGVPVDVPLWKRLSDRWEPIKQLLIADIDSAYGVYVNGSFSTQKFTEYLWREGIAWPRLESGELDLADDTFERMSDIFPKLRPLRYLRSALSKLRLSSFTIGRDGFNRAWLAPFWTITGRNQPSPSKFIFGASSWLRGLVKAPPGYGLCYIDWVQQEYGTAAALSGDPAKIKAYNSTDSYLWLAKEIGAVPPDATKETHELEREIYKQCTLGTQYEMQAASLAVRIGKSKAYAKQLLQADREIFHVYWEWLDTARLNCFMAAEQSTVFGWRKRITSRCDNPRAVGNFFSQANGGEMMRLAAIFATEARIQVCAPVHDAFLIMAPLELLDAHTGQMRRYMEKASEIVLDGFCLRTEEHPFPYPKRYSCKKGEAMWNKVMALL